MDSPNIKHVPLNRKGALELGINPCSICNQGYASYSNLGHTSCHDNCTYFTTYLDKDLLKKYQDTFGEIKNE